MISVNRVTELFDYDPEEGALVRKKSRYKNKIGAHVACRPRNDGYAKIKVDGNFYYLHRLIWMHQKKCIPAHTIDHIDGNRANNRIENLRDVPFIFNRQNQQQKTGIHSASGLLGARINSRYGVFTSSIRAYGKNHFLGSFKTAEEAHNAYLSAKRGFHDGYVPLEVAGQVKDILAKERACR